MEPRVLETRTRAASAKDALPGPDPEAFVRTHQDSLWRYLRLLGARPDVADDVLQETFLEVLAGDTERATAGTLRRIARFRLVDRMRDDRRRARSLQWADDVDEWIDADPTAVSDRRIEALRTCLERLRGRVGEALRLRHGEGIPVAEVGNLLGLRQNGVKALLRRARGFLRECITAKLTGGES